MRVSVIHRIAVLVTFAMSHKFHHQDVRQGAEEDQRKIKHGLQGDIEHGYQDKPSEGDQAAG